MTALVIVGATGRAAAGSARRAGYTPFVCDLFADVDTERISERVVACPWESFPAAIPDLIASFPPGPVLCAGGMENHPAVVANLAETRELLGSPAPAMRLVRDPFAWPAELRRRGLPAPLVARCESLSAGAEPQRRHPGTRRLVPGDEERWLVKPVASAGGLRVRFFDPATDTEPSSAFCLQRFIPGRVMSALFTNAALIGFAEQFPGAEFLHAKPFAFAEAMAPVAVADSVRRTVSNIGTALVDWAGLRGVWGLDFILNGDAVTPIEINPRYPATAELHERAWGVAVLSEDAASTPFTLSLSPEAGKSGLVAGTRWAAKGVYYAPHKLTFPHAGPWDESTDYADIPAGGSVVEAGMPVLTVFAPDSEGVKEKAAMLDRLCPEDPR